MKTELLSAPVLQHILNTNALIHCNIIWTALNIYPTQDVLQKLSHLSHTVTVNSSNLIEICQYLRGFFKGRHDLKNTCVTNNNVGDGPTPFRCACEPTHTKGLFHHSHTRKSATGISDINKLSSIQQHQGHEHVAANSA